MLSRNLTLLLVGLVIAALTLLISWRLGFVFFLLPLFFFWSWGSRGGDVRPPGEDLGDEGEPEEQGPGEGDEAGDARRRPGPQPPAGRGVDGEGI